MSDTKLYRIVPFVREGKNVVYGLIKVPCGKGDYIQSCREIPDHYSRFEYCCGKNFAYRRPLHPLRMHMHMWRPTIAIQVCIYRSHK